MNRFHEADQAHWSLETLNNAYRQGYMFGLSGESVKRCPFQSAVIAAAWEAGWTDGAEESQAVTRQDHGQMYA